MEIIIDKELIQQDAEVTLNRQLTEGELEDVHYAILDRVPEVVQESIARVISFNEMMERNKDAEKSFPQYRVMRRNENAYIPDFKVVGTFKRTDDAVQYIHHDVITEFDEYKVVQVDEDGKEKEVYKIHC